MNKFILLALLIPTLLFSACAAQKRSNFASEKTTSAENANSLNSYVAIFEIPAEEFERAVNFYQNVLAIQIEIINLGETQMGLLPYEDQMVIGTIIKEDGNKPSANGVTIYLNAGENLQIILDRVENNGGKIITKKTPHGDESGYFAIFLDSEGNKIGLHSPK